MIPIIRRKNHAIIPLHNPVTSGHSRHWQSCHNRSHSENLTHDILPRVYMFQKHPIQIEKNSQLKTKRLSEEPDLGMEDDTMESSQKLRLKSG